MNIRGLTPDVNLERWGENFNLWAERNFPRRKKLIMGYSQGGRLALHAVAQNPNLWAGAIYLSTNPGLATIEEKKVRKESDQKWAQRFQNVEFERVVHDWNQQSIFSHSSVEPIRSAQNYDVMTLAKALTQWSVAQQKDFKTIAPIFQIQNLWLAGELDSKYVHLLEELEQTEKPLQTAVVEGASHRLIFDQPQRTAEYIRTFLARV
jgi:2-succinyl-6-hydroxy-2,4-cyclohexadiene-1-carboxylate synthase